MIRKTLVLLALPLLMLVPSSSTSVTSGSPAEEKQFQAAVQIWTLDKTKPKFLCSGVVIAPDTVLTAKSCIPAQDSSGKKTTLFISTAPKLDFKMPLAQALAHHVSSIAVDGIEHADHDLMLIFLKHRLYVEPALLLAPSEVSQIRLKSQVFIAGYGFRGESVKHSGLRQIWNDYFGATSNIDPGEKFVTKSQVIKVETNEVHLGQDASDGAACLGDEGAPVFSHIETPFSNSQRLVGLVVTSAGQRSCAKPSLALRLDGLRNFINDAMVQKCQIGERVWCQVEGLLTPDYDERTAIDLEPTPVVEVEDIAPPPLALPEPVVVKAPEPPPAPKPIKRRVNASAEGAGCSCQQVSTHGQR